LLSPLTYGAGQLRRESSRRREYCMRRTYQMAKTWQCGCCRERHEGVWRSGGI